MSTLHQHRQLCPRSTNTSHSREQNNGCGGGGATLGQGGIFSISHALLKAGGGCLQQALLVLETTGEASPVLPWLLSSHQGKATGSGTKLGEQGKAGHGVRISGWGRVDILASWWRPWPVTSILSPSSSLMQRETSVPIPQQWKIRELQGFLVMAALCHMVEEEEQGYSSTRTVLSPLNSPHLSRGM